MKKRTLLILTYATVITGLMISVKLFKIYVIHDQTAHLPLFADCRDPNPNPNPGE